MDEEKAEHLGIHQMELAMHQASNMTMSEGTKRLEEVRLTAVHAAGG